MAHPGVAPGSLAFVGPPQVPTLNEFHYVRVVRVDGPNVHVALIDPDGVDEDFAETLDITTPRRRLVGDEESRLWPGMFVGHPVAFIQPEGPSMDQWAFGVVTGYSMVGSQPWIHLLHVDGARKVELRQRSNVIVVDWLNYVLQTGTGTNVSAQNAAELLEMLNEVSTQRNKSRSGVPAKVTKALSVTIDPASSVPVIRPNTLAVVWVPRQHVLDCATKKKGKKGINMFEAPSAPVPQDRTKRKVPGGLISEGNPSKRRKTLDGQPTLSDESDEESPSISAQLVDTNDDDVLTIQRLNRPTSGAAARDQLLRAVPDTFDEIRGRSTTTFRPTTMERRIHSAITHPNHQGKDAQCLLEYVQQARANRFRATPPVLRGAYDFGFHVRGLSVLHFGRVSRNTMLDSSAPVVNMTDFSRKNGLQPVKTAASHSRLVGALANLLHFGRSFYNEAPLAVLEAAVQFVETFADGSEPDLDTTRLLVLWIDMKLCKFRGFVVSDGIDTAASIKGEFTLNDSLLSELLYDQQQAQLSALKTKLALKQTTASSGNAGYRIQSHGKQGGGVPAAVLRKLPKQGPLSLCLKHISKVGCSANGVPGKFFSNKRGHFCPKQLADEVKDYIVAKFGGLAPEYENL